jgi:hypothetical protein
MLIQMRLVTPVIADFEDPEHVAETSEPPVRISTSIQGPLSPDAELLYVYLRTFKVF